MTITVRRRRPVSRELKLLCRLVALHAKAGLVPGPISIYLGPVTERLTVIASLEVGRGIRCLAFRREGRAPKVEEGEAEELILAFNWFSPKGLVDYLALGWSLASQEIEDERGEGVFSRFSRDTARNFCEDPVLLDILKELPERNGTITLTGFSMGGALCHSVAYHLIEQLKVSQSVKLVAFGSSRPGSAKLAEWFDRKLHPDSMNVILAGSAEIPVSIYDPVSTIPSAKRGFDVHPKVSVLFEGEIYRVSPDELVQMDNLDDEGDSSSWKILTNFVVHRSPFGRAFRELYEQLHSILKYYENM